MKLDKNKIDSCLELLLQVMEIYPEAKKHVEQYISYSDIHEFKESLKEENR